tara:strand:+ start:17330 stop:18088 length:759 start_codon:yes stop_codon:yes gene_type:complete
MKLLIDNREPASIIKYLEDINKERDNKIIIETKNLEIGDYIFYNENSEINELIIERKSLTDLESSIKDGRYNEQSYRLTMQPTHNHNIIYLIEGNIQNYKKNTFKQTLYSTIFSLNYYKGFSVICSHNDIETGEIIYNFICKLCKEKDKKAYYSDIFKENEEKSCENKNYLENIKTCKKSYITPDNILELMLMQIPSISNITACAISKKFGTMTKLLESLNNEIYEVENIKLSNGRKINKNIVSSLKKYLLL